MMCIVTTDRVVLHRDSGRRSAYPLKFLLPLVVLAGCAASFKVERVDSRALRAGQPETAADWEEVRRVGGPRITVVKLNCPSEHPDDGGRLAGLDVRELCIEPRVDRDPLASVEAFFEKPDAGQMVEIERVMRERCLGVGGDDETWTCFFHCTHGRDRTGLAVAMYRVLSGWTKDAAIKEAQAHGMRPFVGLLRWWRDWRPTATKRRR